MTSGGDVRQSAVHTLKAVRSSDGRCSSEVYAFSGYSRNMHASAGVGARGDVQISERVKVGGHAYVGVSAGVTEKGVLGAGPYVRRQDLLRQRELQHLWRLRCFRWSVMPNGANKSSSGNGKPYVVQFER